MGIGLDFCFGFDITGCIFYGGVSIILYITQTYNICDIQAFLLTDTINLIVSLQVVALYVEILPKMYDPG